LFSAAQANHALNKKHKDVENFVNDDPHRLKWSSRLKECIARKQLAEFSDQKIIRCAYRPFTTEFLFYDQILTHRRGKFSKYFPDAESNSANRILCVSGLGHDVFISFIANRPAEVKFANSANGLTQCFPFYTYSEDGSNRRENITDWALEEFRETYGDYQISKWDIFHYTYAVLHHPEYRTRYAANLKRELPRIPYAPAFPAFVQAGKRLAELHVDYEKQKEYPLERHEKPSAKLDLRVEKMRLSKDKQSLIYNDFLTLTGIPKETYDYRLGNRSALEWVIDQYQVSTDKRSGITNDPNREDDPEYILRLIGQVITVSLETVKIVNALPVLGLPKEEKAVRSKAVQ
jgi:predicted helicase